MAALAESAVTSSEQMHLTVSYTEAEKQFLCKLSDDQRSLIKVHISNFAKSLENHCLEKCRQVAREKGQSSAVSAAKIWEKGARKLRRSIVQCIHAAQARIKSESAECQMAESAEARAYTFELENDSKNISHDPYAILNLELPSDALHSNEKDKAKSLMALPSPGDWSVYGNPKLPLIVDVGCGSGQWCIRAAFHEEVKQRDDPTSTVHNYLGVEIREGLVRTAIRFRDQVGCQLEERLSFWHGEVSSTFWIDHISSYPGDICMFCCQLPDPRLSKNMRRKGKKNRVLTRRRIVQPDLARSVVGSLNRSNGVVYISSDYIEVAQEMAEIFSADERLKLALDKSLQSLIYLPPDDGSPSPQEKSRSGHTDGEFNWLKSNPFNLPTEREIRLQKTNGRKVFRIAFECSK